MGRPKKLSNLFKSDSKKGTESYDNPRENIDPHIRTKVVSTKEAIIGGYTMPSSDGTASQILQTDGAGTVSWAAAGAADNLGNHIATQIISGSDIYMTGNISGATFQGDGSGLTGITASGDNLGNHIATQIISGSDIYLTGDINGETISALSGAAATNASNISTNASTIDTVSGSVVTNASTIDTVSGSVVSLSGSYFTHAGDDTIHFLSGAIYTEIDSNTTLIDTVSGSVVTNASTIDTVSGSVVANTSGITALSGAYYTHAADTSDPHGTPLTQTNLSGTAISSTAMEITGDKTLSGSAYVPNVIFGTSSGAHTASGYTQGTIMFIYS